MTEEQIPIKGTIERKSIVFSDENSKERAFDAQYAKLSANGDFIQGFYKLEGEKLYFLGNVCGLPIGHPEDYHWRYSDYNKNGVDGIKRMQEGSGFLKIID